MKTMQVDKQEQAFEQLVAEAVAILAPTNWEIGRIASESKEVTGKTDAELGERIGLEKTQVRQRRNVWDRFTGGDTYPRLTWSHFYAALLWEDAEDVLSVANDDSLSVADMKRYRRAKNGEPEPAPEIPPITDEQIETGNPLTQPSNRKVTPATAKKIDTGTSGDTAERADRAQTAASVEKRPDEAPASSPPGAVPNTTAEQIADALKMLRGVAEQIEQKQRKKVAAELRKTANTLDPPTKFVVPSVAEVAEYCSERKNKIDAESFVAFYAANGWKLSNGNKMADWKSAVVTWEKRDGRRKETGAVRNQDVDNFEF